MSDTKDEALTVLRSVPPTVVQRPRVGNPLAYVRKQTINAIVEGAIRNGRARAATTRLQGDRNSSYKRG